MMLTHRPLLAQERVRLALERLVHGREELADLMEDVPTLKCETEPFRSPKAKRVKPKPGPVIYRQIADLERAA